ncbi:MAG: hypothetical protein ACI8SI_001880 [Congregibacter sp.]
MCCEAERQSASSERSNAVMLALLSQSWRGLIKAC